MKIGLRKISLHPLYIRWMYWEFWPMQVLYFPVYLQHIWLSIKAKNFFFILTANPVMEGMLLDDPKYKTLQLVPREYLPKTILIRKDHALKEVRESMQKTGLFFPVIIKPNIGYRGLSVSKIEHEKQLIEFLSNNSIDYIMQEYIDFPVEIGIFYYRLPHSQKGEIPSITCKEFLKVTGDGESTLSELIAKRPRAILQTKRFKKEFETLWNTILPKGEDLLLEGIGSHNRGTKFINGNHLKDAQLQEVFDVLNKKMQGFYFGRFDIRTRSIADLKAGKHFKILEVNGVGAEPTHIYDPDYSLLKAWKDMLSIWHVIYRIASQNKQDGIPFHSFSEGVKKWKKFSHTKKILAAYARQTSS